MGAEQPASGAGHALRRTLTATLLLALAIVDLGACGPRRAAESRAEAPTPAPAARADARLPDAHRELAPQPRPPSPPPPPVQVDARATDAAFAALSPETSRCFTRNVAGKEGGRVIVDFAIDIEGNVADVKVAQDDFKNQALGSCLVDLTTRVRFRPNRVLPAAPPGRFSYTFNYKGLR